MSVYVLNGLRPWVIQRISAVFIALFVVYALICFSSITNYNYDDWVIWLFSPLNTILSAIFTMALLFHAWIGMRDVVLDYVHHFMWRILLLTLIAGTLLACGIWVAKILLLTFTSITVVL